MPKFFGKVGFAEDNVEIRPGVWEDIIVERSYYGDIVRESRRFQDGSSIIDGVTIDNRLSILSDSYAINRINSIRYVIWSGTCWEISSVEIQNPRLILSLGGVYNGPKVATP